VSSPDESHGLQLDRLYDQAPCGLLLVDGDGLFISANATFLGWFGYQWHELVGRRRFQDLLGVGGRIFYQTHIGPLLRMQGSVAEVKLDMKHGDGRMLPILVNMLDRQDTHGKLRQVAVFMAKDRVQYERELVLARERAEDLLERQAVVQRALSLAEARLRVALDTARLCVWHVDPITSERHYGDGTAALIGRASGDAVSARDYHLHISPVDREREAHAFALAMQPTGGEYRCVYKLDGDDGAQRTILATGRGLPGENGRFSEFIGVLHDITELSRAQTLAEDRALFAEQMVAIVSHDLRTPLTAISLGADAVLRDAVTPRQERMLVQMGMAVDRAARMINDLLDFTQARVGRGIRVRPVPLDLHAGTAAALAELRLALPGRDLLHIAVGPAAQVADTDRVTQFIGNLVANAAAYGDPTAPITVTSTGWPGGFQIGVHNLGTPIPGHLLERIFEPMTRGEQAIDGIGLGLFIVSQIVKAHGGRMEVNSTADEGTRFCGYFAVP
jgi:phosphoserine phosphatase RsbU/P